MEIDLRLGDCVELLKELPDKSVDAVITDPPYGVGKAEWDHEFPTSWYAEARRLSQRVVIITGACGLKDSVKLVGEEFVDVIAGRNLNSLTRGPLGFNNAELHRDRD
jgi:tRNA G10  N-methylase Trm11